MYFAVYFYQRRLRISLQEIVDIKASAKIRI